MCSLPSLRRSGYECLLHTSLTNYEHTVLCLSVVRDEVSSAANKS